MSQDLHQLLSKLKKELESLDTSSEIHKEINSLIADIELQLKLKEASLTENIRNHIEKFEAEHPRITNILSEIMNKLLNIGV